MKKKNEKKGILFWITGLSGSGKTSIANKIKKEIIFKYGPTLLVNGDDLRRIFKLNKYDQQSRAKIAKTFSKFTKFITNQNINLIFTTVSLFKHIRAWNRKNIDNYVEIFIKADIEKIKKFKKKKLYFNKKNLIVGLNIKSEFPKKPNIIIKNDFKKNIIFLSNELKRKLIKKYE